MSFVNDQKGKRFNMDKKIPRNPKYKDVQSNIDTGASMSKYMRKIEDIRKNYKFRQNEIFKRMKITTFVQLLIQVERINNPSPIPVLYDDDETSVAGDRPDTADIEVNRIVKGTPTPSLILTEGDYGAYQEPETNRSTLLSVARGVGEMDVNKSQTPQPQTPAQPDAYDDCPYLLLDCRDNDEYKMYHIIKAHSYPKAMTSRENFETKEMLQYKNKEGKIIIVYDEDEKLAPGVATTLVQRRYDNVFMLSGGLKVAYKLFPKGLTTGTAPPSLTHQKLPVFESASKNRFDIEDIENLEISLDSALETKSSASVSRLSEPRSRNSNAPSRARNSSSMSVASTMSNVSHAKPFKP